jgi:feruloyl esterase
VKDGIIADPRFCTWSARNHICGVEGAPAEPNCLNEIQADGIDRGWDGPRNSHGKRIWPAYDRGINLGTSTATVGFSTAQVLRWIMFDNTFPASNLYEDQEFWYPYQRLREEGAEVTVIAPRAETIL